VYLLHTHWHTCRIPAGVPAVPVPAEPALEQQQLHPASVHQEGEAKLESLVKIGIHRVVVYCCFFVQAVNRQNTLEYS